MAHDLRITARAEKKAELSPSKIENKFTIQGGSKLEVFDDNNNPLYRGEFKSFTSNFLKLLYGSMIGAGTAKAKDLTNTDLAMDSFPQSTFNIAGGAGVKKFGVVVGTNTAAVSVSDYNITVPANLTVNDTVVSVSSVGADSISVEISRQIGNSSGSAVSLKEAGLICGSEDEVDSNVLIARDLLNITLESGKKTTWRYTINFNFVNDIGGFVKTFADKIFGRIFKEATSSAAWAARSNFGCIVYNNKMWVMGGANAAGNKLNDVWYSSDGVTWTQATSSAAWAARSNFGCIVYNNKMWVMGGHSIYNDVWYSSDGVTWTRATSSAAWAKRHLFGCIVYNNKMWVMGGATSTGNALNDVWYSTDGITWTQATSSAAWVVRLEFGCIVYNNKMWVMGGYNYSTSIKYNDVWYSSDGVTWTQATSSAAWAATNNIHPVIFRNELYICNFTNVWRTFDGAVWVLVSKNNTYLSKSEFGCIVYNNKMWVMGGWLVSGRTNSIFHLIDMITEIKPGSSDTPFSATGTALGSLIANGSGSGQLVYGAMPGAATTEPSVSGNKTTFSLAREFTNNSGADITVREVGLFSGADMLARLILATPVTILNGQSDVITVDFETEV